MDTEQVTGLDDRFRLGIVTNNSAENNAVSRDPTELRNRIPQVWEDALDRLKVAVFLAALALIGGVVLRRLDLPYTYEQAVIWLDMQLSSVDEHVSSLFENMVDKPDKDEVPVLTNTPTPNISTATVDATTLAQTCPQMLTDKLLIATVDTSINNRANVREEPIVDEGNIVAKLNSGDPVILLGTLESQLWFHVLLPDDKQVGWIWAELLKAEDGTLDCVNVVQFSLQTPETVPTQVAIARHTATPTPLTISKAAIPESNLISLPLVEDQLPSNSQISQISIASGDETVAVTSTPTPRRELITSSKP